MSCDLVREYLQELLEERDEALPGDLRRHLEVCPSCRQELAMLRDTWRTLGRIEEESSSERMRARFHAMLAHEAAAARQPGPVREPTRESVGRFPWWGLRPAFQAGLLAATLLVGVLLGTWAGSRQTGRNEIEGLRAEMRSMTRAVTLSLLQHQSASERLRGIGLSEEAPADGEMVQVLLGVVNDDPSVNVRLAALEVLASMRGRRDVVEGLLASFPHQASAPVTAAMASTLLELDGAEAADAVRAAATDDRLPDTVRQYLTTILAKRGQTRTGAGT